MLLAIRFCTAVWIFSAEVGEKLKRAFRWRYIGGDSTVFKSSRVAIDGRSKMGFKVIWRKIVEWTPPMTYMKW